MSSIVFEMSEKNNNKCSYSGSPNSSLIEKTELSKIASKQGVALCRRLSFAVGFNRRIINSSGFAGSSVGFIPL